MKHQIEYIETEKLVPYARNSRTHSDEQVQQIMGSIKEFGFTNPVLVDGDGVIIAGHGRTMAAQRLGMKEVPCLRLSHLTEAQKRAYVIADNKLALNAGWDDEMLALELRNLRDEDFDLSLTGFDDAELAALLADAVAEGLVDEDAVPEAPEVPVTVEGDVWLLGRHRLMCGDSTSIDAVERLMDGRKADMVFTDPPYGMFLDTDYKNKKSIGIHFGGNRGNTYDRVAGDHDDFTPDLIQTVFAAFPRCAEIFLWGADYYAEHIPNRNNGSWIVWDKVTNSRGEESGCAVFHGSNFELCWSKNRHKRELSRVMHKGLASVDKDRRVHPTQKPPQLAEWFFERWGKPEDTVVDLYGGSGSTLIACEKTARDCRMMELDPKYCDVIIKRWQDFTGQEATLEGTGQTYDELKAERGAA